VDAAQDLGRGRVGQEVGFGVCEDQREEVFELQAGINQIFGMGIASLVTAIGVLVWRFTLRRSDD